MLMYVEELIIDLLIINERQAKTGMADIAKHLKDRHAIPYDKRMESKLQAVSRLTQTDFF